MEYNAQYLSAIRPYLKPGALITDVGSTKTDIHKEILRQGLSHCFVGGHPMAGSEKQAMNILQIIFWKMPIIL